MMLRAFLFACLLLLPQTALAKETPVEAIAEILQAADSYSYVLSAGGEDVKVKTVSGDSFNTVLQGEGTGLQKGKDGVYIASPHLATRIAPFVLQRAFVQAKKTDVKLEVTANGQSHILYAAGTAEAVYALRLLGPDGAFIGWLDAHAPLDSTLDALGSLPARTEDAKPQTELIDSAKAAYTAHRPALMRRFNKSYLYYGAAKDMAWSLRRTKDKQTFYAVASAGDLMYMAQFWFSLAKSGDGKWVGGKIYGEEIFKGE